MRGYKISCLLDMDAATYFAERDSAAFRKLAAQTLKLEGMDIESTWQEAGNVYVRLIVTPSWQHYMPAHFAPVARRHVGNKLIFTDILEYSPQKTRQPPYELSVTTIPPVFRKKAHFSSRLRIEDVEGGRCRQTLEGKVHLRVGFGLGPLAEKVTISQLRKVYHHLPKVVDRWVEFRSKVLAGPGPHDVLTAGRPILPAAESWKPRQPDRLPWLPRPAALPWRNCNNREGGQEGPADGHKPHELLFPPWLRFWEHHPTSSESNAS